VKTQCLLDDLAKRYNAYVLAAHLSVVGAQLKYSTSSTQYVRAIDGRNGGILDYVGCTVEQDTLDNLQLFTFVRKPVYGASYARNMSIAVIP
jgi:hypothetical protein